LLGGIYAELGLSESARKAAIIAVDKILKIGADGVTRELQKIEGISQAAIDTILKSTTIQCPIDQLAAKVAALNTSSDLITEGVQDLITICSLLPASVQQRVVIDYTGLIVETGIDNHPEFGTVVSGGRYENLASEFTDQKLPGVGVSIGLSRLMELAFTEKLIPASRKSPTEVLITVYDEGDRPYLNTVAQELRGLGVATEVFYKCPKLGKQIEYAEAKGIRYVAFVDATTRAVQIKDIVSKEQVAVSSLSEWVRTVRQG
jgi:histidyl-tRNA synthetase